MSNNKFKSLKFCNLAEINAVSSRQLEKECSKKNVFKKEEITACVLFPTDFLCTEEACHMRNVLVNRNLPSKETIFSWRNHLTGTAV